MSTKQHTETVSSQKMLFSMAGIGTLCALFIVLTYEGTLPRIQYLRSEALKQSIFKVLPGISETKTFQLNEDQGFTLIDESDGQPTVFAGYDKEGNLIGIAIEAEGQGYADKIKILYGYDPINKTVIGFYVLETKETPGLGDKIEKDENFLQNFVELDVSLKADQSGLANAVVTVKSGEKENPWEVDGITGATISSRAIGEIINESASRWGPIIQQNLKTLKSNSKEVAYE
ncbi:MAG: FMN-binding protein [Bacteroidota bacterium]